QLMLLHGNVVVWDGAELVSIGGADPTNTVQSATWVQAPDMQGNWTWRSLTTVGDAFSARAGASAAWDGREALVFGGAGSGGAGSDLWSLRPHLPFLTVRVSSDAGSELQPLTTADYTIQVKNT